MAYVLKVISMYGLKPNGPLYYQGPRKDDQGRLVSYVHVSSPDQAVKWKTKAEAERAARRASVLLGHGYTTMKMEED